MHVFKYLMLCVSLVLALPSYAAENVFNGGISSANCIGSGDRVRISGPLDGSETQSGQMRLGITGIQLNASADNPNLTGLTSVGPGFECPTIIGFYRAVGSGLARNLIQVGTLEISRPWYDNEYFDIGGGLAMKVIVGDNPASEKAVTQGQPRVITYENEDAPEITQIGLYLKATLKVVDKNVALGQRNVKIGTFKYTLTDLRKRTQVAYAPITFDIQVTQASLRSCQLTTQDREFNLAAVKRQDVFVRGAEVYGGDITIGPIICDKGVDVKVSFFDNHSTDGLTDHLRTVYSDTLEPSQYALKFYPSTGGGQSLQFLPLSSFSEGRNPEVNATTIDFAKSTVDKSTFQKNYRVNYVRLGSVGNDRPGKIKGIMTVQFLYL